MGKLILVILVIALVLIILPSDLREWCLTHFQTFLAKASSSGNQTAIADSYLNSAQTLTGV